MPISRSFGFDRGKPIDRYYIEHFLSRYREDIQGHTLEIGDATYTRQFGTERIQQTSVLHAVHGNPEATIVGDLATGSGVPVNTFNCMILTQTLPFIFDIRNAIENCYRALKPGGVILSTSPGISQISRYDADRWGDYWRLTSQSARRLFGDVFGPDRVEIQTYGNVLVACAFLQGLAVEELKQNELDYCDPDYPVIIAVRAVKPVE